ncbi:DUF6356 family protein [Sphingomonas carotinifaciens]|uniref:DUF6356 family protein n=1 Tax=Sphingomonas carotinifaciens TaxID=1166323 RepID=UPI000DDBC5A8|nr:DUF6356 family protein [Sphingomonas carotinifaciens]
MRALSVLDTVFARHPRAVGESYLDHARTASRFGLAMLGGGLACMVHAAVPALFTTTGSDTIRRLHARMSGRAGQAAAVRDGFCYEI